MATFVKRSTGQWQAKIRKKGFPNISKTFETKADAESWAHGQESQMKRHQFVDGREAERTSFKEALERYKTEVSALKKGHEQEAKRIKMWKDSDLAERPMAGLKSTDFAKWRDKRLKEVSPTTVRLDLALISHLFTTAAKEWGMPLINPIKNIKLPTPNKARDRRLEKGEEKKLLKECDASKNTWLGAIVRLAIETGMRKGELLKIQWEHVNLKARKIQLYDTKNSDNRAVPLSATAQDVLKGLPRAIKGAVFPTSDNAVKLAFIRACERAEIQGLTFHDLRHEATSRFFERGLDVMQVSAITGHKNLQMLKRYTHPRAEDLAELLG